MGDKINFKISLIYFQYIKFIYMFAEEIKTQSMTAKPSIKLSTQIKLGLIITSYFIAQIIFR